MAARTIAVVMLVGASAALAQPTLADIREALLAGELARAEKLAADLSAVEPDVRASWELQAAAAAAAGRPLSEDVLAGLARPGPGPRAPRPGQRGVIAATSMRLRARSDLAAPVVGEAAINTPVTVVAVRGEWAQLVAHVPAPRLLVFDGAPDGGPPTDLAGWMPWRFWAPAPVAKDTLVTEASALERWGSPEDAARLLERAALLDPFDRALMHDWARAAFDSRHYDAAFRAMTQAAFGGGPPETPIAPVSHVGCRGNLLAATIAEGSEPSAAAHACVSGIDVVGECAPVEPFFGAPYGVNEACEEAYRGDQSRRACELGLRQLLRSHGAQRQSWESRREKLRARLAALRRDFPRPAVHFTLAAPEEPAEPVRVWAYQVEYTATACGDPKAQLTPGTARLSTTSTPLVRGPAPLWVIPSRDSNLVVGLIAAPDEAAARAQLLALASSGPDARALGKAPRVALPGTACPCGSSPALP